MNIDTIIVNQFPKAGDCMNGHIGPFVVSDEQEIDDDRFYDLKVTRCDHCGIPISEVYA